MMRGIGSKGWCILARACMIQVIHRLRCMLVCMLVQLLFLVGGAQMITAEVVVAVLWEHYLHIHFQCCLNQDYILTAFHKCADAVPGRRGADDCCRGGGGRAAGPLLHGQRQLGGP